MTTQCDFHEVSVPQEYGKLRRSGSFQKLRQKYSTVVPKNSYKKLRGTPTNLPSFNSMHFPQHDGSIKRASSMSVLNHLSPSYPLQQQQTNRTLVQNMFNRSTTTK